MTTTSESDLSAAAGDDVAEAGRSTRSASLARCCYIVPESDKLRMPSDEPFCEKPLVSLNF